MRKHGDGQSEHPQHRADDEPADDEGRQREVLHHHAPVAAAELEQVRQARQVVAHQRHVRGFECDIGTRRAHRDPDMRRRERRGIVGVASENGK